MKYYSFLLFVLIAFTSSTCNKAGKSGTCYKGRLEIKALCMNYTISVLEGNADTGMVAATWTDPSTGKTYQNAFRLASVCSFPSGIKEGDEFYFEITSEEEEPCAVCKAYYPTPEKSLSIKVLTTPCP